MDKTKEVNPFTGEYFTHTQQEYLDFKKDLDRILDDYLKLTSTARADLLERILDLIFN